MTRRLDRGHRLAQGAFSSLVAAVVPRAAAVWPKPWPASARKAALPNGTDRSHDAQACPACAQRNTRSGCSRAGRTRTHRVPRCVLRQAMDGAQTRSVQELRQRRAGSAAPSQHKEVRRPLAHNADYASAGFHAAGRRMPRRTGRRPARNPALCRVAADSPVRRRNTGPTKRERARQTGMGACPLSEAASAHERS
jgi:hypothetical protein